MKIEIVTTGDEILQGIIVDTNTAWLSERCLMLGHEVIHHTAVGDDKGAIGAAIKEAAKRAECVIVSGGLGPTCDDITIDAAANAFHIPLHLDSEVLEDIRKFFERTGRQMSKSNEKQAMIPEGGKILPNPVGTAPGVQIKLGKAECFFLPGVPRELYQIFKDSVAPWLSSHSSGAYESHVLRCFGLAEATIDEKLKGIEFSNVRLSFRVKYPEILLKLQARAENGLEAKRHVDAAVHGVMLALGDVIYGEGETSMAEVIGKMLREKKMTLSVAESCTGGLISSLITDIPGSSEYFDRGVVSYSNASKEELLGVSHDVLRANGAVSRETALAMAEGVRRVSGATIGISVTGIAGPGGGSPEKPVGLVHMAYSAPDGTEAFEHHFAGDRERLKQIFAMTALDMMRKYLLSV